MDVKNIRIKDISRLAGVSIGTVDRVLHNRGNVSAKALHKIMEVLDKTGYKPNLLARTLSSNKKYIIASLIPDPSLDEYWQQSDDGIKEAREEWSHYNIELRSFYFDLYDRTSFRKKSDEIIKYKPDAILASPIFHSEALDFFDIIQKKGIPFIFFNSDIPEINPLCFIGQNLYQSGRLCAELLDMLIGANSHDLCTFAVLHVYEDIHNSVHLAEKEKGFTDYFKEKNNSNIDVIVLDYSKPDKILLEKELSALLSDPKIKGLHVTTSKGVFMTAESLEKMKRKDVRLVGYDLLSENIYYLKKGYVDFLIHQNPKRQAALGVSYLANYLLFKKEIPSKNFFPLEIISRQNLQSVQQSLQKSQAKNRHKPGSR